MVMAWSWPGHGQLGGTRNPRDPWTKGLGTLRPRTQPTGADVPLRLGQKRTPAAVPIRRAIHRAEPDVEKNMRTLRPDSMYVPDICAQYVARIACHETMCTGDKLAIFNTKQFEDER